jgi:hypothetical protein
MHDAYYFQHAVDCGLDMTSATALGINDARGLTLAHAVLDPEFQDVLLWPGTCLTVRLIDWLKSFGVDYVTVRA